MSVKPIFFALDGPNLNEFEFMLKKLEGHIFGVKVGLEMFISEGPKVVEKLKKDGWTVFIWPFTRIERNVIFSPWNFLPQATHLISFGPSLEAILPL